MAEAQEAAWHALLDLNARHPQDWTLVGGQLVHLHCAERGYAPQRPTDDADAIVDARVPEILGLVTRSLVDMGFTPEVSADGLQHRWARGVATIDVLIPEGIGERAAARRSASGFPTISAPGGTQALHRSEIVAVQVGARTGSIARPNLIGAMIMKAAARLETTGAGRDRHCDDFAVLVAMLGAVDLRAEKLSPKDRRRLMMMVERTRASAGAVDRAPGSVAQLDRLERALKT
jgi:hypothetical protein